MKHWFKDQHFRSLLKNSSYLGVSKDRRGAGRSPRSPSPAAASAWSCSGRSSSSPATSRRSSGIAKFQSWQLIVRYGGHGVAARRSRAIQGRHRLCLRARRGERHRRDDRRRVRCCPSSAAGSGSTPQYLWLAMLYCTSLPTMAAATPDGVLRVLDRFDLISWAGTASPIAARDPRRHGIRADAPFAGLCRDLVRDRPRRRSLFVVSRLARAPAHGLLDGIRPTLRPTTLPGAWRFAIDVNLASSVAGGLGPDRPARRRRPARARRRGPVPHRLEPRRQRAEAVRPARQGVLSRNRADGPDVEEAMEADAPRHGAGHGLALRRHRLLLLSAARH